MPHWENCKLLPFNNSSDIYHISLSAFVARKLKAGSHNQQEQLCWFPCGEGTRGPGGGDAAGVRGQGAEWGHRHSCPATAPTRRVPGAAPRC